jgi:metallo-beta-lactamase family protein
MSKPRLSFFGATQTVTGSRYLLSMGDLQLLIDCGLFQGYKHLRLKNWASPPFDPRKLHAVLLTHAHIDHSGYLPLLVKSGFRGPIFATPATIELCRILLPDSGHLQEEQAGFANRHGLSKHRPALPLYTEADARACLSRFQAVEFGQPIEAALGVRARFSRAGHILGAASIHVDMGGSSVLFSGDLGRAADALMQPPESPPAADYVIVESTYGGREHPALDPQDELQTAIERAFSRSGSILVPTFAVGRAQSLLVMIARLQAAGRIPRVPVYLDSPMAIDATDLLRRFRSEHRLTDLEIDSIHALLRPVRTPEESKRLDAEQSSSIILAASGMATGGRVVHHLKIFAPNPRNVILFAGYQAGGTRGASLVAGARTVRIHGQDIPVKAEVLQLSSMSAHADGSEILEWLRQMPSAPRHAFITHGEANESEALRWRLKDVLGWSVTVPEYREEFDLTLQQ